MKRMQTKILVEAGVLIALATILSMIKVYSSPQGGSVTAASMVPMLVFALRRGPRAGLLAGVAYGLVQMAVQPFIVHPIQALLDYPIAFGLLGLAGITPRVPVIGSAVGVLGRFVSHFAAGVVFFGAYAPPGTPVVVYSLVYNASYLVPEVIISAVVIYLFASTRLLNYGLGSRS